MDPATLQLAIQLGLQLTQAAADWQAKLAAGTITDADIDAELAKSGQARADLVAAIDKAKAEGR